MRLQKQLKYKVGIKSSWPFGQPEISECIQFEEDALNWFSVGMTSLLFLITLAILGVGARGRGWEFGEWLESHLVGKTGGEGSYLKRLRFDLLSKKGHTEMKGQSSEWRRAIDPKGTSREWEQSQWKPTSFRQSVQSPHLCFLVLNTNHSLLSAFLSVYQSVSSFRKKLPEGKFWGSFAFLSQESLGELAFDVVYKKRRLEWRNSADQADNYFVGIEQMSQSSIIP